MAAPSFDLIEIIGTLQKRLRFILVITVLAAALGALFHFVKKKKYKAESHFFVNNPLYGDRNTLFRSFETRYVDYFGGDDDLDKVTALGTSDTVIDQVVRNCDFDKIYKMGDMHNDTARAQYKSIFMRNFNLKRSEYKDIAVSYIAYDPVTAAGVVNMYVRILEERYRHYYTSMKYGMRASITNAIDTLSQKIGTLTDTLAALRDRYGIYGIISPGRQNTISGEIHGTGKAGFGKAMEEIQNIESIKDQYVTDRAHDLSLLHEFAAAASDSIDYLKVITRASPPTGPTGPSLSMTLMIAAALGLFFSVIYVLIVAYFRKISALLK